MKRPLSLLSAAGLLAAAALGISVISSTAMAAACKVDNGGGCEREGMKCDPPKGGRCVTGHIGTRELTCTCETGSSRGPRGGEDPMQSHPGDRPGSGRQPTEPSEPTEPKEDGPGQN